MWHSTLRTLTQNTPQSQVPYHFGNHDELGTKVLVDGEYMQNADVEDGQIYGQDDAGVVQELIEESQYHAYGKEHQRRDVHHVPVVGDPVPESDAPAVRLPLGNLRGGRGERRQE